MKEKSTPEKLLYRPAEAAAALGICLAKFWLLAKAGEFQVKKIGTASVVAAEELRAFIDRLPNSGAQKQP